MTPLKPDLQRLGDALRAATTVDLAREQRAGHGSAPARRSRRWRPRMVAGGTLGLAGVGAALVVALSAGGATAPPAFAVTRHSDGTVLVALNRQEDLGQANQKLAAMGTGEQITLYAASTPRASNTPVTCVAAPGAPAPNPPVQVTVNAGTSAGDVGNTGSTSAVDCVVAAHAYTGPDPGNSGSGNSGTG